MALILPTIPRFVFTVFEPLSLVAGFLAPMLDTTNFINSQLPSVTRTAPTATSKILALQLGNVYGLIGMIGIGVLYTTTEPIVVRNYLVACAVADVGHMWVTANVMGFEDFTNVQNWNSMAIGNIGITAVLLFIRLLYLSGAFGQNRVVDSTKSTVKKNA